VVQTICQNKDDWSYTLTSEPALFADRGFTGHEHLEQFGLINMNGRLYDPIVGRFLSPDNYVQDPGNTQSLNRYGYCLNNPLRYTDPSGDWIGYLIYAAFVYFKTAHDNRDVKTGEWAWNPLDWFGKDSPGVIVGVSTNSDFSNVNYYAGLSYPDYSPVLSYNPNYGLGIGNASNPGSNTFYYPSYNPPSAEQKANEFISKANTKSENYTPWMDVAKGEIGVKEINGINSSRIVSYFDATNLMGQSKTKTAPWCAAFANWSISQAGIKGTGSALGSSFSNWGNHFLIQLMVL
jgi:RHS repeat-associated protein